MPRQILWKTLGQTISERNKTWFGMEALSTMPELKAAGKRIALDHILRELLIEVARMHSSPGACLDELQARVHDRFKLETEPGSHEVHVHAEAANYADEYFEMAREIPAAGQSIRSRLARPQVRRIGLRARGNLHEWGPGAFRPLAGARAEPWPRVHPPRRNPTMSNAPLQTVRRDASERCRPPGGAKGSVMMLSRLSIAAPLRAALLAAACLAAAGAASAAEPPSEATPDKPAKAKTHPVTVTREMIGAGIVSSGVTLPPPPPATGTRANPVPSWAGPLPWPILIADRRNNRLLEVTPDKRIVWEFPSPALKIYRGNDDVNFSPDGKTLVVNEEDNFDIHFVDYEKRALAWTYGTSDVRGSAPGYLNYPDDARLLPDGRMTVADIRNCRLLFIDPKTSKTLTEWGKPGACKHAPPDTFAYPNDINFYDNGDFLVTEIPDAWITRLEPRRPRGVERQGAASALSVRRQGHQRRQHHRRRFHQAGRRGDLQPAHRQDRLGIPRGRGREDARSSLAGGRTTQRRHPAQ